MPSAATPRQKHSPSASSTSSSSSSPPSSSPHRSPRLIRLPSRSTPAPSLLDQMEDLTIKDRRSQGVQGGKSTAAVVIPGDSQESRMAGLGIGHGHQRRPADLGRPAPPLGIQNQVQAQAIGFRSPSSEPSFMAPIHARSEYKGISEGSSSSFSSFSSSDQPTVRGEANTSSSSKSSSNVMGEDEDDETIRQYQGGTDLERSHTRHASFAPIPPSSRAQPRQPVQPDQLRDPYDFSKSYDDHDDDDDDQSVYERNLTDEVITRAGTPLFSAGPEERYELLQKLGQGNFGTVWKALDKETNEIVAIKHVFLEDSADEISEIQAEITFLSNCNSPHITRYLGSFVGRKWTLWIIMEYLAGGSGSDIIKPGTLNEPQAAIVIREVLYGLEYLHGQGIIHRDIKAANIIFSDTGEVKLADFGVSGQLRSAKSMKNTFVGTPLFMAPEVILQGGYGAKADLWSLGITAIEFVTGKPPYGTQHPMKLLFLIPQMEPPKLEGDFSAEFKDFISHCLVKDPAERWSTAELLDHPFIRKAGRIQSLQRLINRYSEFKRQSASHARADSEVPNPTINGTIDGEDDGWDFGNGTVLTTRGASQNETAFAGTIRPGKGSEARVFERDVQPYQVQATLGDAYPGETDERRRTFIVNDDVPDDFEEAFGSSPSLKSYESASQADSTEIRTPPLDTPKPRSTSISSSNAAQQTIKPAQKAIRVVPAAPPSPKKQTSGDGVGEILIRDVVLPVVGKTVSQAKSAADLQALHSIQLGFQGLVQSNPELANQMMIDIMAGMRDNDNVRAQLTQKLGTIRPAADVRQSFATPNEVQSIDFANGNHRGARAPPLKERNPVNDMLYMRWLDGLRLKWPLAGSS